MKIKRQLAWPCRDCKVRATNFCSALMDRAPTKAPATQDEISQVFFSAEANNVVRHEERAPSSGPYVLCKGWAFRFFRFPDGRRQILSVLIPGDLFFTSSFNGDLPQFSVQSATDIQCCELNRDDTKNGIAARPSTFDAFKNYCMQEGRDSLAALTNFGEQDVTKRVENFARGIVKRLVARDIKIADGVYPFPLTHADIADATCLDIDDVNRAIHFLRSERVIDLSNGRLTIIDPERFEGRPPTPFYHDITNAIARSEIWLH